MPRRFSLPQFNWSVLGPLIVVLALVVGVSGFVASLMAGGTGRHVPGTGGGYDLRPPELVRHAIEHEYYERTLRGSFIDAPKLLAQLGLDSSRPVPGYPQLMRPCDIDGRLAYHLTTFFEKGGIVTVFAFDQPVSLKEDEGWWNDVYWQVVTGRDGRPLILVSEKKKALTVAQRVFAQAPG